MPRSSDLAIFVLTTDKTETLPLAHARGVMKLYYGYDITFMNDHQRSKCPTSSLSMGPVCQCHIQ